MRVAECREQEKALADYTKPRRTHRTMNKTKYAKLHPNGTGTNATWAASIRIFGISDVTESTPRFSHASNPGLLCASKQDIVIELPASTEPSYSCSIV